MEHASVRVLTQNWEVLDIMGLNELRAGLQVIGKSIFCCSERVIEIGILLREGGLAFKWDWGVPHCVK